MSAAVAYQFGEGEEGRAVAAPPTRRRTGPPGDALSLWLASQRINTARHAGAIRPFQSGEFGTGPASPSEAHRQAANALIGHLRRSLVIVSQKLTQLERGVQSPPSFPHLRTFETLKETGQRWVEATEKVWNFYFELFNQRQTMMAGRLLASDRIALDCYQAIYTRLGKARSIPSPAPFSYMESGFGPATFRRSVLLTKLGKRANPFPLIRLPYHRLVNPWTLGAIAHETAHNVQSDLGLWRLLPRAIFRRLVAAGVDRSTATVWARWHKEMYADLCGLLLTGPAFVTSLMDILSYSPERTVAFNPRGVHPIPYLRVFINLELLRRMGFADDANEFSRAWSQLYPRTLARAIPASLMRTFPLAHRLVVETMCFAPYSQYGGKSLAQVVKFSPKEQAMVREAAGRLAAGTDPGILPERFLIGASRVALDRKLARPGVIARNFYEALGRR